MPKAKKEAHVPFVQLDRPDAVQADPVNSRVLDLFDELRKRNVGPEKAAYTIAMVHGNSSGQSHPVPIVFHAAPVTKPDLSRG